MTDAVIFTNNATSRLGIDVAAASITVTLEAGGGASFPTPGVDEFFPLIVNDRRTGQFEIMYCTQRINDVLTVDRAQEGTIAQDWLLGASAWCDATAGTFQTYFDYSWSKDEADARFVKISGDAMTGPLSLVGDPVLPLHATTKEWVEALAASISGLTEAPNDGLPYARQSLAWVETITEAEYDVDKAAIAVEFANDQAELDDHTADIAAANAAIALRLTDAPSDGSEYVRKDGAWAILGAAITDAPVDGNTYARKDGAWVLTVTKATYDAYVAANDAAVALRLTDAPSDGSSYGRRNGAWAIVAPLASPAFTGVPVGPTAGAGTSTTQLATTAFVTTADNLKAPLASPAFTGNPTAPTPATSDSDTSIATTAFVKAQGYLVAGDGAVVDSVSDTYVTNANLTTVIPLDDTIPQITEGTEILSVSITPKSTTNKLRARFSGQGATDASAHCIVALFVNATANALKAQHSTNTTNFANSMVLEHEWTPGVTSAQTVRIRVGPSAGTMRMNGSTIGRLFGGAAEAILIVEEIQG